jgi:signal transduction histidine kinase
MSKLFMNFSRLEEHEGINHKGTGLGLSICKSLIELMGGSVRVESQLGEGTTFIVRLKTKCVYHSPGSV